MENIQFIKNSLDILFHHHKGLSYWDDDNHRIRSKLIFDAGWNWRIFNDTSDRYGVFTLFTILLAKERFGLETSMHDEKITLYLNYIKKRVRRLGKSDITYGAFNSLVLGRILYDGLDVEDELSFCIDYFMSGLPGIVDNQDSLLLIGLCLYLKKVTSGGAASEYAETLIRGLIESQDRSGVFQTGDLRAPYHQRLMYVAWALAIASEIFFSDSIRAAVEKTIDFVWRRRREEADDAFLWHPPLYIVKSKYFPFVPVPSIRSSKHLFSCHQTFFVNTVNLYNRVFHENKYATEKKRAMAWIFGENRINRSLVEATGVDIPARIMTTDGNLLVKRNNFVGSYEIGSHILALAGNDFFRGNLPASGARGKSGARRYSREHS